jgi:hypothetical protein
MAWELYYTSAPRGLRPGSRGFCTVARTEGMPLAMADRLESLSGYQPAGMHATSATLKLPRSVLSRVAMGGSDYSGRLNKFAYHLVLETAEQARAGPAWMLVQPGVMKTSWEGDPHLLKPLKLPIPAEGDVLSGLPADKRDARALADAFVADATKSACIVYPPGMDPLPLLADALSLLEPKLRWQVTFSTSFHELSAGLSCTWRCIPAGTPAAADAPRHATSGVVIDLTSH